ncbi:MAG TPA: prolyl oligopeptidase family serine peptidase [Gemmatimonadaceae bacterium]|nr:prolyl oligopeptidase family serine peptidase [Gemmatimonadaceae bacterium]
MTLRSLPLLTPAVLLAAALPLSAQMQYPESQKGDVVDVYHGVPVADPYRWLEDQNSPATAAWVQAQNALTFRYLAGLPQREALRRRLTTLWDYPKTGLPVREGGRLFYRANSGLERQSPLYLRAALDAPPRLLIDPNALSPDGAVSLAQTSPSPDARYVAYALSDGGADWQDVHVREVESGKDLADTVRWVRFSGLSWTTDGEGFFYARYPERPAHEKLSAELRDQTLYYHRVGTPQSEDRLVYRRPDLPTWFVGGRVTEDGRWLVVYLNRGTDPKNKLYVADLGDPAAPNVGAPVTAIVENDDAEYTVIGNVGSTLYVRTDLNAPNRRIIAIDAARPERAAWREIVPEATQPIEAAALVGGRIVVQRLVDVTSRLEVYDVEGGRTGEIALPGVGTVAGMTGREDTPELFYSFTSVLAPATAYRVDLRTLRSEPFEAPTLTFDPARYETTQLFFTSKDGTRVPMFVTARKGLPRNGQNPTMLYAYGGFSVSVTPSFSPATIAWLERGGVYAVPSLRGGAEYGEAWHRAGMLDRKQNVFDDFIAAAEHLIVEGWTSPSKLAIRGGSNGGLLVGAAMTQRPELFGVALPAVGVMDMLRYDRFTGGRAWVDEYGSATEDANAFAYLRAYSPLHNLRPGTCYPATLVTTADHDDRVVPGHSFKFAATLQAAQRCARPTLIRIETQGSHGYRPTDRQIAELADVWAFALEHLGEEEMAPTGDGGSGKSGSAPRAREAAAPPGGA